MKTTVIKLSFILVLLLSSTIVFPQVGIGTANPNTNAMLDVDSTTKGFLPPRMTTNEKNTLGSSLAPIDEGMFVFDTDLSAFYYWNGTTWVIIDTGNNHVDLTTNQTNIAGDKTFTNKVTVEGTLTPAGRLMLPMGELSFVNLDVPFDVTMPGGSTGVTDVGDVDYMVPIAPAVEFVNDNYTFDAGGDLVTTVTNGKLKYTSGDVLKPFVGRYFHIALSFSFSPGSTNNGTYVFGVTKNDDIMSSSKLFLKGTTSGDSQSSAMHVLLFLNDGDEIGYSVGKLDSGGTTLSIKSFNFVAIGM